MAIKRCTCYYVYITVLIFLAYQLLKQYRHKSLEVIFQISIKLEMEMDTRDAMPEV